MPRRASASELARLLSAAPQPVYAVDDAPRIVYLNRACAAWLGCADDELLGQPCVYHSGHETTGAPAVAAALCPPPDALAGRRMRASVLLPNGDAEDAGWTVEFVPLTTAGKPPAGVLCFVIGPLATEAEEARDEDSTAQLHERIARFRRTLSNARYGDGLLGDSAAMRQVRSRIALAASTTASVVLIGPPGSGLQGVARAIHFGAKGEEAGPLVPLSCALLGPALVQSTLRALARERTLHPAARPPTLLLTDVEPMPAEAQGELLARLAPGEPSVRIVSTAHTALTSAELAESFRPDLAAALSTVVIEIPPLTQRIADLPLVAQALVEARNARSRKQLAGFAPETLDQLSFYSWPGDLEELAEVVDEAHARAEGTHIALGDLPKRIHLGAAAAQRPTRVDESIDLEDFLARIERELIERALTRVKGNKTKAARLLGMTRPRFYRRLVQLGLADESEEPETE